ncbi:MAG: redoxin domain-containing protein [Bacteroidetes bacterium]|jgi:thiol-disulfide isomerase/thioredoxin|nr:redoxin domain-containing protein [Bacteroidota bacterium]
MKFLLSSLIGLFMLTTLTAQEGYRIEIDIEGYDEPELYLGYHYGEKQYLQDTASVNGQGKYVFEGEEALPGGVYLVVMAPDNNFFQLLVSEEEQRFSMQTKAENPAQYASFRNAPDNTLFYEYMRFLDEQKPAADKLSQQMEAAEGKAKERLQAKRQKLDEKVQNYQRNTIAKHPNTLTAAIIKANMPIDVPEYEGEKQEVQRKKWMYTREHYFDHIDLTDPRMLRTPFLFQRVDYFVNKLQVRHPDTIAQAIDEVLQQMEPAEETYQYYLIHFLNKYAKSKVVGMDAVYVHLVNNYYAQGKAPWTEEKQLKKIIDNAKTLEPLLIGKVAPNITLETREGETVDLHDIQAPMTVLYFWRYDCGHCKKSTPKMNEFYEAYKDKGVELVAVCAKFTDEIEGCWDYVEEKGIGDWMHMVDTYHRSRFMKVYDIKSTPQIYILGEDKTILSKKIGAEQLGEVVDRLMEVEQQENDKKSE